MADAASKKKDNDFVAKMEPYQNLGLKDKVVIITGSNGGIGAAAAMLFAKRGAKVTIHGRDQTKLDTVYGWIVKAGISADNLLLVQGDICDEAVQTKIVEETVKKFGKIDCLVNNAGSTKDDRMLIDIKRENIIDSLDLLVVAPVLLAQKCHPHLKKTKGNIINIASVAAKMTARGIFAYCVSKRGIDRFTDCGAMEWAEDGIRVNSIRPGVVNTNIFIQNPAYQQAFVDKLLKTTPLTTPVGFNADPIDIAEGMCFLASDAARYMTGAKLGMDGGVTVPCLFKDTMQLFDKM